MRSVDGADAIVVMPADYKPDWMEVTGRKMKMEYVGMGSVFTVIFRTAFVHLQQRSEAAIATFATLFLFMGLKKKTRDHISCSLLLFTAAALAGPGVTDGRWYWPYAAFGACVWAMEGYLEKRRGRIYALPFVLGGFAAISAWWGLGLAFVAAYLLEPRSEVPGIRKRLAGIVAVSAAVAMIAAAYFRSWHVESLSTLSAPSGELLALYVLIAVASVACLGFYWRRLAWPHRVNAILFGLLAPFDARVVALFGMAATVLLSATIFRHGIDSDRWRPLTKHAEWYFFPIVFVVALWTVFGR
jgi:hypothetical protein